MESARRQIPSRPAQDPDGSRPPRYRSPAPSRSIPTTPCNWSAFACPLPHPLAPGSNHWPLCAHAPSPPPALPPSALWQLRSPPLSPNSITDQMASGPPDSLPHPSPPTLLASAPPRPDTPPRSIAPCCPPSSHPKLPPATPGLTCNTAHTLSPARRRSPSQPTVSRLRAPNTHCSEYTKLSPLQPC